MITIKLIPDIFKNEGRKEIKLPFNRNKILLSYLGECGFEYNELRIIVTGRRVQDLGIVLKDKDEIILTPEIKVPAVIWWLPWWAELIYAVVAYAAMAAMVIYSIYSAFQKPRTPSFGTGEGLDEGSPTYGWDGIQTMQDVGIPIPIVYGEHRVGGNIINQFIRTDGDKQYLNILLALCEGEIEDIGDVEINENPSANFAGITLTERLGTNTQTSISNFNDSHSIQSFNINLTKNNKQKKTTVKTDVTAFELNLTLVGGLFQQPTGGNIQSWSVTYSVEYRVYNVGNGDEDNWSTPVSTTISALSRSNVRRVYRKAGLTAGQYDIRVTRTSDDSSLDPMKQGDLYLMGIDEITQDEPLIYPNVAVLGIEALATDQLNGAVPNITVLLKAKKISVPKIMYGGAEVDWENYYWDGVSAWKRFSDDAECTWDNSTYVTKYSANPIWCMKDLLINTRYGLGDYITASLLDNAELLEMAKYCEERVSDGEGGYEKKFRLDIVIDSSTRALDLITQLTATFRTFPFYSAGAIKLKIDKADTPVQMFGMGNIIANSFQENWKSIKEIPNVIEIQFLDKDKDYKQEIISVQDEAALAVGDPVRKKSLRLFCTRQSQCIREGRYVLNIAKNINRTITLKAGIDAIACQAGDLINVSHDVPQWGFSGRVQANSTTTRIYLDRDITIESGKTYRIRIRFSDDTQEERTVSNDVGIWNYINVNDAFGQQPLMYDVYAIGLENIVIKPFRVVALKRSGNNEVEINAIEYDEDVYNTDTIVLPDNNYSALTFETPDVAGLTLTERLVKLNDGTIENVIDVWFQKPIDSTKVLAYEKAKIYLSDDNGASWGYKGETSGIHFAIIGNLIDGITYKVAVTSVAYNRLENAIANSPQSTIQLIGKSAPPSNVTTFLVNQSRDRLYFGWIHITDIDLSGYEIRCGGSWDTAEVLASNIKNNNLILLNFRTGASQSYWIKAIDTSGNYSTTAKVAVITIDNIPFTNIIISYSEQTGWAGTKTHTSKVGNNLEIDATYLTGTYVAPVRDIGFVATFKIGVGTIITVSGDATWQDFGEGTFADSETLRFLGEEIAGATTFEIRTSVDGVDPDVNTWTAWLPWQAGDYKCRWFQLRMTMNRVSTAQVLQCSEFNSYADLPDIDVFGNDTVSVAADGKAVTFSKVFHENPSVNIDILSGDGYVHKFSVVPSITGFTVKLYDLSGTAQTGAFDFHAHGV